MTGASPSEPLNNVVHLRRGKDDLLIHIVPKVASTSIQKACRAYRLQRFSVADSYPFKRWMVVRHPLDRLVAVWAFFTQTDKPPAKFYEDYIGFSFKSALPLFLERRLEDRHLMPQNLIKGRHDVECVAYENLADGWEELRGRYPWLKPLGWIHKSNRNADWQGYYTPQMMRLAESAYSEDLELWKRLGTKKREIRQLRGGL